MFIIEVKVNVAEIVTADIMASKNNMTNQTEGLMPGYAFTNNLHKFQNPHTFNQIFSLFMFYLEIAIDTAEAPTSYAMAFKNNLAN